MLESVEARVQRAHRTASARALDLAAAQQAVRAQPLMLGLTVLHLPSPAAAAAYKRRNERHNHPKYTLPQLFVPPNLRDPFFFQFCKCRGW